MKKRICKDCEAGSKREAPYPGPRCATHHRLFKKQTRKKNHERHVMVTYGLQEGEYDNILAYQGGRCYICQRAKGITKKLCVDHCHETGKPRGLLCNPCNKLIGHVRDDPKTLRRAADYLENSPVEQLAFLRSTQ